MIMGKLDPRLENIFAQAMDIADANERAPFIKGPCSNDGQLRVEVEPLLAAHGGAGGFIKVMASLILALLLAGCATMPPLGRPDLLDFLVDGNTPKAEVIRKLGRPSGTFEADEIFTYRLGFESKSKGYYVVERETDASPWPVWKCAKYSLVLVFNDRSILQTHSLVNIKVTGP